MDHLQIAVILPAYNEEFTIQKTIEDFYRIVPDAYIVVVDNNSKDRSFEVATQTLQKLSAKGKVLREQRQGKGNALRKAFHEIQADIYVMCDADSTYLASDLPKLLETVKNGDAEVVVGNRHAASAYKNQNTRPLHNFGNNLVRSLINFLFGTNLLDIMSGYRVMSYRFVKNFPVLSEGFEVETEMTLHAVDKKFPIIELPIQYLPRPEGSESKLNTFSDGFRVLKIIFWIFKDYRPLFFFSLLSIFSTLLGLGIGIPVIIEFMETGLVPKFPSAILATGLMVFALLFLAIGLILDTVTKYYCAQYELGILGKYTGPFRSNHDSK